MLVLSRKVSQRICLGDSIVVTIVKICGGKVRLGIEAPSNILVLRDELDVRPPVDPTPGNSFVGRGAIELLLHSASAGCGQQKVTAIRFDKTGNGS